MTKQILSYSFKLIFIIIAFVILAESITLRRLLNSFNISSDQFSMAVLLLIFTVYLIISYKNGYISKYFALGKITKTEKPLRYWMIMSIIFFMWLIFVMYIFSPTWLDKIFP